MKPITLLFVLSAVLVMLTACSMDTTGGMERGGKTMTGDDIYEPNFGIFDW